MPPCLAGAFGASTTTTLPPLFAMSRITDEFLREFVPWALRVLTFFALFKASFGA